MCVCGGGGEGGGWTSSKALFELFKLLFILSFYFERLTIENNLLKVEFLPRLNISECKN